MKKIIKRSIDLLLFFIIFIFISLYFKTKINKNTILNYMLSTYHKDYNSYNLNDMSNINLYKYNKIDKIIETIKEEKPYIYIFNTHYEEKYSDTDVIEMSKLLNEKLNKKGITSIFEDINYKEYRIINNLTGINNYVMVRPIIKKVIEENNISLVIDLHRDSIKKEESTIKINNKECAKVLFVVDNSYSDYKVKYELAKKLNNYLNKYKGLSRGIYVKNGKGFNQDLSKNMILLELGGYKNNKNELINTIDIIVEMIGEYINER